MKKIVLAILSAALLLTACGQKNKKEEVKVEPKTFEPVFGMSVEDYQAVLDKSLLSIGNNYRLKKFIEKYKSEQDVYIAAIGGSVTEGAGPANYTDGYFYQFVRVLRNELGRPGSAKTIFNDAGLSGTSSAIGWVRYQSDVVDVMGHAPDLLIIEFAVNDYMEPTKVRGFEAMIRRALTDNPDCAVIVLYAAATYGNTQTDMKPVANYYKVPQITILDAIKQPMEKGMIKKEAFYTDIVHPYKEGHTLMVDCIINLIRKVEAAEPDPIFELPAATKLSPDFVGLVRITGDDENVKIDAGDFNETDENCQTIKKTKKSDFPQNWCHKSGTNSFKMDINCKNLIFLFKEGNAASKEVSYGKAEVYIDGKLLDTYNAAKEGGWNNPGVKVIIDEAEAKDHKVEVKMVKGDEDKEFTIVAMGYSK